MWKTTAKELAFRINNLLKQKETRLFVTEQELKLLQTMEKIIPNDDLETILPGQIGACMGLSIFLTD